MSGVECYRATRYLFSTAILAILFETESVHRKHACVAGKRSLPFGQHLGDAIAEHAPLAEPEVKRMRNDKRENIARPVDYDGTVTFNRENLIAVKPSTRRGRVTTRGIADVWANRFEGGHACSKLRSCGNIVGAHNDGGAQTMSEDKLGIARKYPINVARRIPTICKYRLERTFAAH